MTDDNRTLDECRDAIDRILEQKGITDIEAVASEIDLSSRQLERQFKKMIGLTPKFYSRIIRFSNIFQVMDSEDTSWVKVALQSGYFDQSVKLAGKQRRVSGFS